MGNKNILAVIDTLKPVYIIQIDAMLAAQSLGLKTINGYSSYCHDTYGEFFNQCNENGLNNWLNYNHISHDSIKIIYNR
jgi:hypothetical protein